MSEKARKPGSAAVKQTKRTVKHWVTMALFGVMALVFVFLGVSPNRMNGMSDGIGVAATVNDASISKAEYLNRVQSVEQNAKMRFDQFPEAQRQALTKELRRRALEELILGEVVYQAASSRGVIAPDVEVRDYILQIPFLLDHGRFVKDRYQSWLQNMNLSSDDFERQVRKQLVVQKLQELFVGSATPTREELKRDHELSNHKVAIRFVEIRKEDLAKPAFVTDADVAKYLASNKAEVDKYYKDNVVEFTKTDKVHASHILIRIDEKRPEAEALKIATDLKKQATPQNFAKLATKNSDDPGSKEKGGDLGEFEKGRMVPEFDKAAFALKAGEISGPIKTNYGYHLIYVDKKTPGGTQTLEQAQNDIARKLLSRAKESEIIAKTKTMLEKSDKKDVDALVAKAGLKWSESGEFDLSAPSIPKLGEGREVIAAILKHGGATGLVPTLINTQGRYIIVDVTSWKQTSDVAADPEGMERMVAYKKSGDLLEAWSKEVEAKATVQRNPAMAQ